VSLEKPIIPTFSLQERDRRWGRLRSEMRTAGLEALVSLPNEGHWDQFGADTRYITQIGGTQTEVGAVLPLEDDVTAVVRGENEIEWWGLAQDWVKDIRPSRRSYGEPVIERLKEIRAERVGVIGLSGLVRAPEGVVPWGTFKKIRTALPDVEFENATDLMQQVRSVKSAEEVAFIERAAAIIGQAIDVLIAHAKVGVRENELIAEMLREIVVQGGEPITMLLFGTGGPEVPWAQRVFTTRQLKPGDLINTEVEGKYAGYIAQALQPISLGSKPKELERIFDTTRVIFDKMLVFLNPALLLVKSYSFIKNKCNRPAMSPTAR
jgi:Xaa-Pro dipeptidase